MREIKLEVMFEYHNADFERVIGKHYTSVDRLINGEDSFPYSDMEVICKRQFTGLKDKNENEIYEGDIVQMIGDDTHSEEYAAWINDDLSDDEVSDRLFKSIPKVAVNIDSVVMDRFPAFWLKNESFGHEGEDLQSPCDYEVVGNIYENRGLLK